MAVWEMCRFKGSDVVMLMGSLEQRGLDSAAHSNGSAGILPFTLHHVGTQLQTGDDNQFFPFQL